MIIDKPELFYKFISKLEVQPEVVVDTETTGLELWADDKQCGIGFYFPNGESFYLPFRHKQFSPEMTLFALMDLEEINLSLELLPDLWKSLNKVPHIIGHNLKFDLTALFKDGFQLAENQTIEDTLNGARLYFKNKYDSLSLENITHSIQGVDQSAWKAKFKKYLKDRNIEKHYDMAEVAVIAEYCETDCKHTYINRNLLKEYAVRTEQISIYEKEKQVLKILWDYEWQGLLIDKEYLQESIPEMIAVCENLQVQMFEITKEAFNPWSNQQLSTQLNKLGIRSSSFTPTGQEQWRDEQLKEITHPIGQLITNWREVDKLMNTFFIPYSQSVDAYAHCTFKSWGTISGRLSVVRPNIQQVSRNQDFNIKGYPDFNYQVRKMFIPPKDFYIYCFDFKQMEMIVFADYLEDDNLTAKLAAGGVDFHSLVAKLIWKVNEAHPDWDNIRQVAKAISLGLIYGMGFTRLADRIKVSEDAAKAYQQEYFRQFPTAPDLFYGVKKTIESRGYVENRFGRRYYMPVDKAYAAINYLVQGTSADIVKEVMIRIDTTLKEQGKIQSSVRLQMHDEIFSYIHKDELHLVPLIKDAMEYQMLRTPLTVDIERGNPDWSNKLKICSKCYRVYEKGHNC